jgi:hypothetical protein
VPYRRGCGEAAEAQNILALEAIAHCALDVITLSDKRHHSMG